eukprot:24367-Pyramimonas_sp.AAC.1
MPFVYRSHSVVRPITLNIYILILWSDHLSKRDADVHQVEQRDNDIASLKGQLADSRTRVREQESGVWRTRLEKAEAAVERERAQAGGLQHRVGHSDYSANALGLGIGPHRYDMTATSRRLGGVDTQTSRLGFRH